MNTEEFRNLSEDRQWEAVNDAFTKAQHALKAAGADALDRKIFVAAFNTALTAESKYQQCQYVIGMYQQHQEA